MTTDVMIDCESLDTSPYCVILTIGAVSFNPKNNGIIERLELRPTIEDQTDIHNRIINDDTMRWWSTQNPEAIEEAFGDWGRVSFKSCMESLYKFCWNRRAVWSNGAAFDIVACETGMRQTLTEYPNPIPWPYYSVRDTRTLYEITGVSLRDKKYKTKTSHKAIEDAEHQALVVQDAYKKLIQTGLVK